MKLIKYIVEKHNDFGKSHADKHMARRSRWRRHNGSAEYKEFIYPTRKIFDEVVKRLLRAPRGTKLDWTDCQLILNTLARARQDTGTKNYV